MVNISEKAADYLKTLTHTRVRIGPPLDSPLPPYLADRYRMHMLDIDGRLWLGLVVRRTDELKPTAFAKHAETILARIDGPDAYVLIADYLHAYLRNRLVHHGIPFIVPGYQAYLPALGVAAKRGGWRRHSTGRRWLTPAGQAVLIACLLRSDADHSVTEMATALQYSAMTVSRAVTDLEARGLVITRRVGRERRVQCAHPQKIWEQAQDILRSPVRLTVRVTTNAVARASAKPFLAGESALAAMTMLMPPVEPVYAVGGNLWSRYFIHVDPVPMPDEETANVQVWRYEPGVLSEDGSVVDPISLYLSLRDDPDERIQSMLNELAGRWQ